MLEGKVYSFDVVQVYVTTESKSCRNEYEKIVVAMVLRAGVLMEWVKLMATLRYSVNMCQKKEEPHLKKILAGY